ncbi:MAG: class III signal peptide-containing protein [Candidatus Diapherotrites archaeon]|uniref:Class III signal peptide-containing protein n=1 Tax=Candidatus Iainarchaeum sp. TaxID=3101447 RepID=A0A8T4CAJ5_9ARCH|nr:class III signal peptide-containing protein [Candidatus Diapherotrites archaeon]
MLFKKGRGQGTTEYLIILAIVIVIALVVVGVLGGFPSLGAGVSEGTSKTYWMGTSPLAITEYSVSTTTGTLVVKNMTASAITLDDVNYNGAMASLTDVVIGAGATVNVTDTDFTCSTRGQVYTKTIALKYNTTNLSGQFFTGIQPLVGQCQ